MGDGMGGKTTNPFTKTRMLSWWLLCWGLLVYLPSNESCRCFDKWIVRLPSKFHCFLSVLLWPMQMTCNFLCQDVFVDHTRAPFAFQSHDVAWKGKGMKAKQKC